jgi:hypothetical protein
VNRVLLNGTITVDTGSFWYLQFIIPPESGQIQVSGGFTALGDGNDIRVYIMNDTSFNINAVPELGGHFSAYYDSGQLTTNSINVTLPSGGTYYLVYDNTFSASQKNVNTQVNLSYWYIPTS